MVCPAFFQTKNRGLSRFFLLFFTAIIQTLKLKTVVCPAFSKTVVCPAFFSYLLLFTPHSQKRQTTPQKRGLSLFIYLSEHG